MDNIFLKINKECLQHLFDINTNLSLLETKGDSTLIIYKIRLILDSVLQQIQRDNQEEKEGIISDNTKKEV